MYACIYRDGNALHLASESTYTSIYLSKLIELYTEKEKLAIYKLYFGKLAFKSHMRLTLFLYICIKTQPWFC